MVLSNRRTEPFRPKATRPGKRSGSISPRDRNRCRGLRRGSEWPLGEGNTRDGNIGSQTCVSADGTMPVRAVLLGGKQRRCYIGPIKGFGFTPRDSNHEIVVSSQPADHCVVQQAAAVVASPPRIGQPQAYPVSYYYHGRTIIRIATVATTVTIGRGTAVTGVTIRRTTCFYRFKVRRPEGVRWQKFHTAATAFRRLSSSMRCALPALHAYLPRCRRTACRTRARHLLPERAEDESHHVAGKRLVDRPACERGQLGRQDPIGFALRKRKFVDLWGAFPVK